MSCLSYHLQIFPPIKSFCYANSFICSAKTFYTVDRKVISWKTVWSVLKKLKLELHYDRAFPGLGTYLLKKCKYQLKKMLKP